jgi:hypothetical protein
MGMIVSAAFSFRIKEANGNRLLLDQRVGEIAMQMA